MTHMGKRDSKWKSLLLLELALFNASAVEMPQTSSSYNNTIHDSLLRDDVNHRYDTQRSRQRRRAHSRTSRSSRGSYTMDSASKRFYTTLDSTMPTTPGTLWRHSLLTKVFHHGSEESQLHSETEVLKSGYHNSFGT